MSPIFEFMAFIIYTFLQSDVCVEFIFNNYLAQSKYCI